MYSFVGIALAQVLVSLCWYLVAIWLVGVKQALSVSVELLGYWTVVCYVFAALSRNLFWGYSGFFSTLLTGVGLGIMHYSSPYGKALMVFELFMCVAGVLILAKKPNLKL